MSFAHGAQDGLKFIGIMNIYANTVSGKSIMSNEILIMLICALTMGLGVLIGGKRIVTTVGEKMIKLENKEAFISDITTVFSLITASFLGIPVSTTHVKIIAVATISNKKLDKNKFKEIILAWGLTFPVCIILAYILMKIIM